MRSQRGLTFHRERVELPDGDFVDLDFTCNPADLGDRPLVLLLHGLEGSARSKYALQMYRALGARSIAAVGLNFRSCSGELNRLPRLYHSGDTADLEFILKRLARRFAVQPRGVVGFSLGGNALLKFLGESGAGAQRCVAAAAVVSVPFDLSAGADHLVRPAGRMYSTLLLRKLQRKVRAKRHLMPAGVDVDRALAATTFRDFDDAATAPLHDFEDAEDYYRQSSSGKFVSQIKIPTLMLHAADDPFVPAGCIPVSAARDNPYVVAAFTRQGGHVGFVERSSPWKPAFWAEQEVARYMSDMLLNGR